MCPVGLAHNCLFFKSAVQESGGKRANARYLALLRGWLGYLHYLGMYIAESRLKGYLINL